MLLVIFKPWLTELQCPKVIYLTFALNIFSGRESRLDTDLPSTDLWGRWTGFEPFLPPHLPAVPWGSHTALLQDSVSQMAWLSPFLQPPKYALSFCLHAQVERSFCLDPAHLVSNWLSLCQSQTSGVRDEPEVGLKQEAAKGSLASASSQGQRATYLEREVWDGVCWGVGFSSFIFPLPMTPEPPNHHM